MSDFTADEQGTLAALVDMIIPASARYGVPGAADPAIFADILSDAQRQRERLGEALAALDALARDAHGAGFADLAAGQRGGVTDTFRATRAGDAGLIAALTAQCYYRDDRVMDSIGMEPRPPHPLGYEVAQGDWSLLDPVRGRDTMVRKTS
jgi:hypothetical protein